MTEYISREEAIKELREVYENEYPTASGDFDEYASHDVPNVLRNMPFADVQPVKRGHWEKLTIVPATDTGNCILARCSKCGDTVFYTVTGREITLKYCPNCGARMDLKDGDTK